MTQHARPDISRTSSLWTLVSRTVRPTYGARRNAAEGLRDVQDSRSRSAEAAAALATARPAGPPGGRATGAGLGAGRGVPR